ncbi:sarcosine oxidase subunit delta [Algirhabdus cladophorae]|uniref:sarcosine oxidase subunit delta n=1 Tax=Algirhabdus cladophorae TaxID=3377108 RepID=UPI003B847047
MRLTCPHCGDRDRREFYYGGVALTRPEPDSGAEAWDDFVHLRDNPAGRTVDLWMHEAGCGAWLRVERDTRTHEIFSVTEVATCD